MRSSGNDRDREHAGGEHGLGQQHDQAPGRAIRPLRQADDGERAPDQPHSPVRAGRSTHDIAQVRHGVEDSDQPGRHSEQRREHSHRTRTRLLCTAFPPPPRDDQDARVRRSLRGGRLARKFKPIGVARSCWARPSGWPVRCWAPRRRLDDPADPAASSRLVLVKVLPRSAVCLPAESVTVRRALSAGRRRGRCGS